MTRHELRTRAKLLNEYKDAGYSTEEALEMAGLQRVELSEEEKEERAEAIEAAKEGDSR